MTSPIGPTLFDDDPTLPVSRERVKDFFRVERSGIEGDESERSPVPSSPQETL